MGCLQIEMDSEIVLWLKSVKWFLHPRGRKALTDFSHLWLSECRSSLQVEYYEMASLHVCLRPLTSEHFFHSCFSLPLAIALLEIKHDLPLQGLAFKGSVMVNFMCQLAGLWCLVMWSNSPTLVCICTHVYGYEYIRYICVYAFLETPNWLTDTYSNPNSVRKLMIVNEQRCFTALSSTESFSGKK